MMDLKATLWKINEKGDGLELSKTGYPFRIQDITMALRACKLDNTLIVEIDPYKCNNDPEKIKEQVNILMESDAGDGILVTASAYVSTEEFPEDKFYCTAIDKEIKEKDKVGKQDIPFNDIIARQCKVLEDAGFVNINKYCALEFSEIYISPLNLNGAKVRDKVNEICAK